MLSRQDIIDFCGLTEGEVRSIAKHQHVSDISAASLGQSLLQSEKGIKEVEGLISDDMENAILCGETDEAYDLQRVLADFKGSHGRSDSGFDDKLE